MAYIPERALFYGTLAENKDTILGIGLVPGFPPQPWDPDADYLWLAETADAAAKIVDDYTDEDPSIVISVDLDGLEKTALSQDEDGYWRYYGEVDPEFLQIISEWK
jgi:hypothetical protein